MIPHEKERLVRILCDLNLPEGQWILSGSGVLCLHGIERDRPMGDVDIFVATRLWFEILRSAMYSEDTWKVWTTDPEDPARRSDPPYLYKEMHGIEVNIFSAWRRRQVGNIDVAWWIANAEMVDGWPCVALQFLLDWKDALGRAKDATDIERIQEYLKRRKAA